MKKIVGLIIMLTVFILPAICQDNSSDDVYYQGDDNTVSNDAQDADNTDNNNAPDYQTFYDQLSPYGSWIDYPGYGYVWVPANMPGDFSPYLSGGHWVYTDMGWTWVSDYPWGWGPYHYGRWFMDDVYGWMWIPGYQWAPAWVVWGEYDNYYCWAPIGPGAVISMHYRPDPRFWHFCPHEHIGRTDFGNYVVRNEVIVNNYHINNIVEINNRVNIIGHASTYNQSVFFAGPKAADVERYSGQKVQKVTISNTAQPGRPEVHGTQLNMYRPAITKTASPHPTVPAKTARPEELKSSPVNEHAQSPLNNRNNNNQPKSEPRPAQQQMQQWTPPRQNAPQPRETPQPRQQMQPQRPAQQSQPRPVERNFIPAERPAPQPHYNAPSRPAPAPAPSRGGGGRR